MLPQTSPAPPVRIALSESDGNKSVEVGEPVVLQCQVSDPNAEVSWYKDGIELREAAKQEMLAEGSTRQLTFQSAQLSHAGIYSCKTTDDAAQFHLEVKGDKSHFLSSALQRDIWPLTRLTRQSRKIAFDNFRNLNYIPD